MAPNEIFDPVRATDQQAAGSVQLAVLAVAPWSDYASALQPDFTLNSDDAFNRVALDSRWRNERANTDTRAGVQSTLLSTPENPSGLIPAVPAGPLNPFLDASRGTSASPDGSGGDPANAHSGLDSILKYTAAASLYQEVQLLNRHIRDAAIPAGFRPYMVRLQLSLIPSRRHAPYDAFTTLSFFIPGDHSTQRELEDPRTLAVRSTSDAIFQNPFGNGPKVLPFVVTDNLEASVQSRSTDRLRSVMASILDFAKYGGSASTNFVGHVVEPMYGAMLSSALRDEVYGRDINSLLTVARLSENTLRIRLGAQQETTANYAMVPRNHNITLLLMVPEGAPALVEVVAKTMLVDTETGVALPMLDDRARLQSLELFRQKYGLQALSLESVGNLHALAQQNDQKKFSAQLRDALPEKHPSLAIERLIWIELVGLQVGDQFVSNLFELPGQGQDMEGSSEVFRSQTVVIEDNGDFAYVTLREARLSESKQVLAVLRSLPPEPTPAPPSEAPPESEEEPLQEPAFLQVARPIVLPAESLKSDLSRRELRMRFPSLKRWGLAEDGDRLLLELSSGGERMVFDAHLRLLAPTDASQSIPLQRKSLEPATEFDRPAKQ
jgi:hypothetical protein